MSKLKLKSILFGCGLVFLFTIASCESKDDQGHEHGEDTHTHEGEADHTHDDMDVHEEEEISADSLNKSVPMESPKEEEHKHDDGTKHTH